MSLRRFILMLSLLALLLSAERDPAAAHPMGNFSINHYARFIVYKERLTLLYVLDMAEIPTVTERQAMDTDQDGKISVSERTAYLRLKVQEIRSRLSLRINDRDAKVTQSLEGLEFRPGAGGLETLRLTFTLTARLSEDPNGCHALFKDSNYTERTGWKEIVAIAKEGASLSRSTAADRDLSRELTAYPADPATAAPQQTEAEFTIDNGSAPADTLPAPTTPASLTSFSPQSAPASGSTRTPQDGFTQSISRRELTPGIIALSLGLALLFGAFHALSPGHGKAMVAAYLVGSRGTIRHAVFLGAVITLTHTISVFALGLITLIAAQYVVPERMYPLLSLGSGAAIVCVGAALGWKRLCELREARREHEDDREFGEWEEERSEAPLPPNAPISLRSLVVLGITGGALPCPSALVVMFGAIAMHRIAFGLLLICTFSLGLASVLTGIGILVVRLRHVLERLPLHSRVTSRLPLLSAALVTLVGLVLIVRALHGQF